MKRIFAITLALLLASSSSAQIVITRKQAEGVIAKCDSLTFYQKYSANLDSTVFEMGKQLEDGKQVVNLLNMQSAVKDTLLIASQDRTARLSKAITTRNYIIAGLSGIALLASIICVFTIK
jgi:hypothetical protein